MRRLVTLLSVVALVLVGGAVLGAQPRAIAQEATPAAPDAQEDVTVEPVAFAFGVEQASPADLFVARIGLEPGAGFPLAASDPSAGLCLVEAGEITIEADAPVSVTRGVNLMESLLAAEESGDMNNALETIAAGEAVTLQSGDAAYVPGGVTGEIRNDGDEPAVCLAIVSGPAMGMMTEATPEP